MKKRIFTLFALAIMLGSVFSIAKAQIKIDSVTIYNGCSVNGKIYEESSLVPSLYIRVVATSQPTQDTVINITTGGATDYLGFPTSVLVKRADLAGPFAPNDTLIIKLQGNEKWNMPNDVSGTAGSISAAFKGDYTPVKYQTYADTSFMFYNMPQVSIKFYTPTVNYPGKITLSMAGGDDPENYSRYIWYTWANTSTTPEVFTQEFTDYEIENLEWNDTIWVTGPCGQTIAIPLEERIYNPEVPGKPILRAVSIQRMQDAYYVGVPLGTIYVASATDLTFNVVPTGENVGLAPVLKTNRKAEEVLGQTWTRQRNADGSYTVVIKTVQEPFTVGFDFNEDVANENVVDNNSVWSANGQLYVTSAIAANAKVYTVAGALVKTVTLTAGETVSTSLSSGLYIVTLNDNSYKVVVQ